jgi:hypothetical protein
LNIFLIFVIFEANAFYHQTRLFSADECFVFNRKKLTVSNGIQFLFGRGVPCCISITPTPEYFDGITLLHENMAHVCSYIRYTQKEMN